MIYVQNPNIPLKKVRTVIVDYRIGRESVETFNKLGINIIYSTPVKVFYESVNGHPDMQIHHLGGNRFVCIKEVYDYYKKHLPAGASLICCAENIGGKYPYDVLCNAAALGCAVVCNAKYSAAEIISQYERVINVKQGYAKCSVAIVSENAAITADTAIAKAMTENGIDVLRINEGEIALDKMSYGFIGGACGLVSNDILAVNGNIKGHSSYADIQAFCKKYGVEILELNDKPVYDIGSIIPIMY